MLVSLLMKLAMFALTMGVIVWIGWEVPRGQSVAPESNGPPAENMNPLRTEGPASMVSETTTAAAVSELQTPKLSAPSRTSGKIDINRATEQDLESLPGIGPVLAGRIVEHRHGVGSFRDIEDLRDVKGIGKKKFDRIRNLIKVTSSTPQVRTGKKAT